MKAYSYDQYGVYSGEVETQLDQLESKKKRRPVHLLPARATFMKPTSFESPEPFAVLVWTGSAWVFKAPPPAAEGSWWEWIGHGWSLRGTAPEDVPDER